MWWKIVLRAAVAVGLDKWAKRKAVDLITKVKDKAKKKVEGLEEVKKLVDAAAAQEQPAPAPALVGPTAVFRSIDGRDYSVRVEREV